MAVGPSGRKVVSMPSPRCTRCGRPIRSELSVSRGCGPVCWGRSGAGAAIDSRYTARVFIEKLDRTIARCEDALTRWAAL